MRAFSFGFCAVAWCAGGVEWGKACRRDRSLGLFSVLLAGGGVRGGFAYGETDELGYSIVRDPVHVNDLHATVLHLLGLDHEKLTYKYQGREFRLTDVAGRVARGLLA